MIECPNEVVETGRSLIAARKLASSMSDKIDIALAQLDLAVTAMHKHGAKTMQAGAAIAKLRQAQAAYGLVMEAHDSLRCVLTEHGVDQPTDVQIASIR